MASPSRAPLFCLFPPRLHKLRTTQSHLGHDLGRLILSLLHRGRSPPQGWRSWNLYGNNVNQSLITGIMDGMVKKQTFGGGKPTSLCDLGYCDVGLDGAG